MYSIIVDFHNRLEPMCVASHSTFLAALMGLENYVADMLLMRGGVVAQESPLLKEPRNKKGWKKMPFGYFKTRNIKDSFVKQIVWQKTRVHGWIYNSVKIEKLFAIDITRVGNTRRKKQHHDAMELTQEDFYHRAKWDINMRACFEQIIAYRKKEFSVLNLKNKFMSVSNLLSPNPVQLYCSNLTVGLRSQAAATPITLVKNDAHMQLIASGTTSTVKLPADCHVGEVWTILNGGSGTCTVQSSGANTLTLGLGGSVLTNTSVDCICLVANGTNAAAWWVR